MKKGKGHRKIIISIFIFIFLFTIMGANIFKEEFPEAFAAGKSKNQALIKQSTTLQKLS